MSFSFERVGAAVLAAGLVFSSGAVLAQKAHQKEPARASHRAPPAPPATPQPAAPAPAHVELVGLQAEWTKLCGHDPSSNKDVCLTTRDFSTAANKDPLLSVAVVDIKGDDQRFVRMRLPVGLLLKPGFRFAIDKGAAFEGDYQICLPNGCFSQTQVKVQTIDQLKRGSILNIAVKNPENAEVTFVVPLDGFSKAFDGPAIDPKVLAQQQQALQQQLQKRAEEERQRLEATKSAPAPAAPIGHLPVPATPAH